MAVERFPVEAGHIMMFARAVGDDNPIYFNDQHAKKTELGHIIAPPTFVQASAQFDPDYFLRPKAGQPWFGSGKNASGLVAAAASTTASPGGSGGLHAEQHFEYHRHPQPGDVLSTTRKPGKTWERESARAGKLSFVESITEYRDQNGQLVVTARSVGVRTERPVAQPK